MLIVCAAEGQCHTHLVPRMLRTLVYGVHTPEGGVPHEAQACKARQARRQAAMAAPRRMHANTERTQASRACKKRERKREGGRKQEKEKERKQERERENKKKDREKEKETEKEKEKEGGRLSGLGSQDFYVAGTEKPWHR